MLTIFDCDGVLIDSELIAAQVNAEFLKREGLEISAEELMTRFAGFTHEALLQMVAEELGRELPDDFAHETALEIDRRLASVPIIEGAHEMLDLMEGPRCVCSNSEITRLEVSMGATGLWDRFKPYIFSAPEVGTKRPKPAPDVYLFAAEQFSSRPAETVVIEDSVAGVTGAARAGMRVIGFTGASHSWPGHAEALMEAGAETVVRRLADLPALVPMLRGMERLPG